MTTKTINALVTRIAAIDGAAEERIELIKTLAKAGKWADREAARDALLPLYAAARGITLTVATTGPSAGKPAWPADAAAAKKGFQRLLADLFAADTAREEVEIPEELLKAAAKLARLAAQYEGARKLASAALAKAFAA
jgi:hypothetical protein